MRISSSEKENEGNSKQKKAGSKKHDLVQPVGLRFTACVRQWKKIQLQGCFKGDALKALN